MPAVSPSPVTPVDPTGNVPGLSLSGGGSTWAASGVSGCPSFPSGQGYQCSGPWMIETQDLGIQYVRVPVYGPSATTFSLTEPTCEYRVGRTVLQSLVTAHYQIEKSYDNYSTSAFTQPQTFEWYPASADSYGNTYGAVGVSALGPQGNVQTKQKWYHRRLWQATDTETLKQMHGLRHFEVQYRYQGTATTPRYRGGINNFGEFKNMLGSTNANTFLDHAEFFNFGDQDYTLFYQYITSQENPTNIANYIDGLGHAVTNIEYWVPDFDEQGSVPSKDEGFAEYSVNRHSWT